MINLDYLYNPAAAKDAFNKNCFLDKKLGFQIIENGTILPYETIINGQYSKDGWGFGGIVDDKGKFVRSSHVYSGAGEAYTPPRINSEQLRNRHLFWVMASCLGTFYY